MVSKKLARLVSLVEAHSSPIRSSPKRKRFKAINSNPAKLGADWARERSAAARMTAIVVGHDSEALLQRVGADPETPSTFESAVGWLEGEASLLRKLAARHEIAANRLSSVIARYKEAHQAGAMQS